VAPVGYRRSRGALAEEGAGEGRAGGHPRAPAASPSVSEGAASRRSQRLEHGSVTGRDDGRERHECEITPIQTVLMSCIMLAKR